MRYYCTGCEAVMQRGLTTIGYGPGACPFCGCEHHRKLPDYETPEQDQKRTGVTLPDDSAVWVSYEK